MRRDYWKIVLGTMLSNAVGAFIVFFYFAYVDIATYLSNKAFWRGNQADWGTFSLSLAASMILAWGFIHLRAMKLIEIGENLNVRNVNETLTKRIQRMAADFPLFVGYVSWFMWLLVAVFFSFGGRSFGTTDLETFRRTFLGVGVVGGLTISMLIFLFVDRVWSAHIPKFFPKGHVGNSGAQRVSVGLRLLLAFIMTGLVPLISLGVAAQNSAVNIMDTDLDPYEVLNQLRLTIFFIVGVSLISNLLLSALTTRGLLRPLQTLAHSMNRVGEIGDLSHHVPVAGHDEIGDLTDNFNTMLDELQQGQQMRELFGKYVSKEVATKVIEDGANLGGVKSHATALFADIRNFTSMTEKMTPEQIVDILNRYYTKMVDVVVQEGGIVNKFGGDSLLAIFGVPIRQSDHPLRAVRAAWQMNRAMAEFNAEQAALGQPQITIGIGIASGEVMAGNIGGTARLEYTIIGDPVNLASRLQDLTKEYKTPILVSQETAYQCQHAAELRSMGHVSVKGKAEQVHVFELNKVGV